MGDLTPNGNFSVGGSYPTPVRATSATGFLFGVTFGVGHFQTHVADDNGAIAAMLALHLPKRYLDQLFVAPDYQGRSVGRQLLAFTRTQLPDEIWLRCARENEKAWRWYERERFVFQKQAIEPMNGLMMKYYRWRREAPTA